MPHRPAQVLSASGRAWGAMRSLRIPTKGVSVVNLIPTHNTQKAGRHGLSGVHARRMESKAVAGTARSWSPGPALVLETAARAAPAPTGRCPVGLRASTFTPTLPALSPQLPSPSEVSCGVQDEMPGWEVHTLWAFALPRLMDGPPFLRGGAWGETKGNEGPQVQSHRSALTQGSSETHTDTHHPGGTQVLSSLPLTPTLACLPVVILPASSVDEATGCGGKRNLPHLMVTHALPPALPKEETHLLRNLESLHFSLQTHKPLRSRTALDHV